MTKDLLTLTIGALICAHSLPAFAEEGKIAEVRADHELSRLAFGSCLRNPSGAEILDKVVAYEPDLFVWLGDNIYVDSMTRVERFDQLYGRLGDNPRFQQLRKTFWLSLFRRRLSPERTFPKFRTKSLAVEKRMCSLKRY